VVASEIIYAASFSHHPLKILALSSFSAVQKGYSHTGQGLLFMVDDRAT